MKKNSFWRLDTQLLEEFRMPHWQLNHFPYKLDFPSEPSDIFVGYTFRGLDLFN
ncbi:hypothetical protein DSECCO2_621990 [anaerobic digester metagenome]